MLLAPARPVLAASVPVRYDAAKRTIYVGADYTNPAYKRNPAAAPKTAISIPAVAAALGTPGLLEDQGGGAWLLRANMVVSATARLEASDITLSWLRLDSTPGNSPANVTLVAEGGHLLIEGIKLSSWNRSTGTVDTQTSDGRSYLVARRGARMEIVRAEVSYLGASAGEPSGLSWRLRADQADPTTGATGRIVDSDIHHNYFGQYSFEAYGLTLKNSTFHANSVYGIDPHDYSSGFLVENNQVYDNGKHGIIFSRGCNNNVIRGNTVYSNGEHGIMLDRGSNNNLIEANTVYDNNDGVAIFQSANNSVHNNILRDNLRGIRINATYDRDDEFDGTSIDNTVSGNTISNNTQYGIYLYERADRNRIVANTITTNGEIGIYLKTFGNQVRDNQVRANGRGLVILGGELTPFPPGGPAPVPALGKPGRQNVLARNLIEDNNGTGVQLTTAYENIIGSSTPASQPGEGNTIRTNGSYGVALASGSSNNTLGANIIEGNGADGVLIKGSESRANRVSRNAITANNGRGLALSDGANGNLAAPTLDTPAGASISGGAPPGTTVELYRDPFGEGRVFKGSAKAASNGRWNIPLPTGDDPREGGLTALASDTAGNTSPFGGGTPNAALARYEIGSGTNGEPVVYISGAGARITLPEIRAGLRAISPTVELLQDQGGGVWQANISLFVGRDVTLALERPTVSWLKLRSQGSDIPLDATSNAYNYRSFVWLKTYNGTISLDGVKVTSWNPALNDYDRDVSNGRSYLLAKYAARMDIRNSELSYLGFADGESYGVSWRDVNDPEAPDQLLTRVTGTVTGSSFSHNYYGVYTFQAANMLFRGNTFRNNIGYGFDPHDYSHHFVVEDNLAYENGNHGFIISRGCNNFTIRRNQSYNNRYSASSEDRLAHGFMLDPGSPNSRYPQVASYDNLLEANRAWGNDGYGLRVLGSHNNTVRDNWLSGNLQGITLEQRSSGNLLEGNTIERSGLYGIYLIGSSDGNTISNNSIERSGRNGIYIKTGANRVTQNRLSDNGTPGATPVGSGIAFLQESDAQAAAEDFLLPGQARATLRIDSDLPGPAELAGLVRNNQVNNNTIIRSANHGIELKHGLNTQVIGNTVAGNGVHGIYITNGSNTSSVRANTVTGNRGHGIRANGSDTSRNTWSENAVYGNGLGGIVNTSGANSGIEPPDISAQESRGGRCAVAGKALPAATVEIYSDDGGQGRYFEGRVTAAADGTFSLTLARKCLGKQANALATDAAGNSSGFATNMGGLIGSNRVFLALVRR